MTAQHLRALELANAVRYDRAEIRRRVRAAGPDRGPVMVAALLEDREGCEGGVVASMPVLRLLTWPVRLGPKAAVGLLRQVGVVGELRQVRQLTDRQRLALAARLRDRCGVAA